MIPARGLCLVRAADTDETVPGGRVILPSQVRDGMAQYQMEVLAVGAPEACKDRKCQRRVHAPIGKHRAHPTTLVPGAWVVVKHRTLTPSDDPLGKTFYVRQSDVLAVLRSDSGS